MGWKDPQDPGLHSARWCFQRGDRRDFDEPVTQWSGRALQFHKASHSLPVWSWLTMPALADWFGEILCSRKQTKVLSQEVPRWGELEPLDKSRLDHKRKHFPLICIGFWRTWQTCFLFSGANKVREMLHVVFDMDLVKTRLTVFTELDLHFNVLFQALFRRGQAAAGDLRVVGFVIMAI